MKLATFIAPGEEEPRSGEVRGDSVHAFEAGETVLDRLRTGSREPAGGPSWQLSEVRLLAPLPEPRDIYCVALNYAKHAAEGGQDLPEAPAIFTKPSIASAPPSGPVRCPEVVRRLDYEAELVAVLGPGGEIAGYAVADDVSARDLQKRERHWTRAKGAGTFCPWGPWITTADEVGDPGDLRLRSWVNGELRQDASTADMIFTPRQVLDYLAETCELGPGDILLTGTPEGVGFAMDPRQFLAPGDRVKVEIEGLGSIEHEIVAP